MKVVLTLLVPIGTVAADGAAQATEWHAPAFDALSFSVLPGTIVVFSVGQARVTSVCQRSIMVLENFEPPRPPEGLTLQVVLTAQGTSAPASLGELLEEHGWRRVAVQRASPG
jgi:hypothetical protein